LLPTAALCLAAVFAPFTAHADTDLPIGGSAYVAYANGDNVNVRTEPGADADIIGEVAEGASVYVIDGLYWAGDGSAWYQVEANGMVGYIIADYLAATGGIGGPTGDMMASEQVYVRSGPSTADPILANLQGGDWVTLHGESQNGFLSVIWGEYVGWVYADYLTTGGTPVTDTPSGEPAGDPAPSGETGTRFTNDSVNLRAGASLDDSVITVLPAGAELWLTGRIANGFAEVDGANGIGWVAVEYLSVDAPAADVPVDTPEEAPAAEPAAPAPAAPSGSIIWPVSGGEWSFLQGYNGSSHYDSGLWQYGDSIDLVRTDGSTAGQPIYAPVSGTIRWFDPSTGGMTIDMGNGYAFAMFHAYYDGSLQEGDYITQGQYVGTIAPAYEAAAGSTPHLHISLWATEDGGNWSRESVPFTGALAISGSEFYNTGVALEHTGTIIYP
jgi:uncharacterized protein YraI